MAATASIHDRIGWFTCANLRCGRELGRDHVTVTSTAHVRRFCSYYCIAQGIEAWRDHLDGIPNDPGTGGPGEQYADWIRRVWEAVPDGRRQATSHQSASRSAGPRHETDHHASPAPLWGRH